MMLEVRIVATFWEKEQRTLRHTVITKACLPCDKSWTYKLIINVLFSMTVRPQLKVKKKKSFLR